MTIRKRGKYYQIDISHPLLPGGRLRISTRPANKEQTKIIHNEIENQLLSGQFNTLSLKPVANITFAKLVSLFNNDRSHELASNTMRIYKYAFIWFEKYLITHRKNNVNLKSLMVADVKEFKKWAKEEGLNNTTYNMYHRALSSAFDWGIRDHTIAHKNPFKDVSQYPTPEEYRRDVTPAELVDILKLMKDEKYKHFVIFLFISGMRRSEALNLKWDDVDWERRFFVIKAATAKGKKYRIVPMSDLHYKILKYRKADESPFNYTPNQASKRFTAYARKAGYKNISLHCLRHGSSTQLFMASEHPLKVKNLLGHNDLKTTLHYSHMAPGYIQSSVDLLGKLGEDILNQVSSDTQHHPEPVKTP